MVLDDFLNDEIQKFLGKLRVQIARLEELAAQANLDPEFAKKFLNFIIQEVIQHHKQHQS